METAVNGHAGKAHSVAAHLHPDSACAKGPQPNRNWWAGLTVHRLQPHGHVQRGLAHLRTKRAASCEQVAVSLPDLRGRQAGCSRSLLCAACRHLHSPAVPDLAATLTPPYPRAAQHHVAAADLNRLPNFKRPGWDGDCDTLAGLLGCCHGGIDCALEGGRVVCGTGRTLFYQMASASIPQVADQAGALMDCVTIAGLASIGLPSSYPHRIHRHVPMPAMPWAP